MTTRQIAAYYRVSATTARRWLNRRQVKMRPRGHGLAARGLKPVDQETLQRLVHVEHQSLREIGALYGIDHTAILYWLDRYQIPHPKLWVTRRRTKFNVELEHEAPDEHP